MKPPGQDVPKKFLQESADPTASRSAPWEARSDSLLGGIGFWSDGDGYAAIGWGGVKFRL